MPAPGASICVGRARIFGRQYFLKLNGLCRLYRRIVRRSFAARPDIQKIGRTMTFRLAFALCAFASLSQIALASNHPEVTPYDALRTRLVLTPGQTYLGFMRSQVK